MEYPSKDGRFKLIVKVEPDAGGIYTLRYCIHAAPDTDNLARIQLRNRWLHAEQAVIDGEIETLLKRPFAAVEQKLEALNARSEALNPKNVLWEPDGSLCVYAHPASGDVVGASIRQALARVAEAMGTGMEKPEDIKTAIQSRCRALAERIRTLRKQQDGGTHPAAPSL